MDTGLDNKYFDDEREFTYSLCMIVKNEEAVLKRCLDSFAPLFDEIVVVDTGSTDATKEIAASYTDKIYDFKWIDDFSAARNFAFSKCTCDYIYSCDADEVLDECNKNALSILMEAMMDEIDIVQMKYVDRYSTVLNVGKELRPKMFKRLRTFRWQDPVHESVRLDPIVYDSEVEILHLPEEKGIHAKRDFDIFLNSFKRGRPFSKNMFSMYATELFICGDDDDFLKARQIFEQRAQFPDIDTDARLAAYSVLCRCGRICDDIDLLKYLLLALEAAPSACSEICCETGRYFYEKKELQEAVRWYQKAIYEARPVVYAASGGKEAYLGLAECYEVIGDEEKVKEYKYEAHMWKLPEES